MNKSLIAAAAFAAVAAGFTGSANAGVIGAGRRQGGRVTEIPHLQPVGTDLQHAPLAQPAKRNRIAIDECSALTEEIDRPESRREQHQTAVNFGHARIGAAHAAAVVSSDERDHPVDWPGGSFQRGIESPQLDLREQAVIVDSSLTRFVVNRGGSRLVGCLPTVVEQFNPAIPDPRPATGAEPGVSRPVVPPQWIGTKQVQADDAIADRLQVGVSKRDGVAVEADVGLRAATDDGARRLHRPLRSHSAPIRDGETYGTADS